MHRIITTLLCFITLQAGTIDHIETLEVIMPESIRRILELPNRLLSRKASIFPDLSSLDRDFQAQLVSFKTMKINNNDVKQLLAELHRNASVSDIKTRHLAESTYMCFFHQAEETIDHIFSNDISSILRDIPDILAAPKKKQAKLVYQWYEKYACEMCNLNFFIKQHVRFSDAEEDQWGRLIINGEEVYRGKPHEE